MMLCVFSFGHNLKTYVTSQRGSFLVAVLVIISFPIIDQAKASAACLQVAKKGRHMRGAADTSYPYSTNNESKAAGDSLDERIYQPRSNTNIPSGTAHLTGAFEILEPINTRHIGHWKHYKQYNMEPMVRQMGNVDLGYRVRFKP